MILGYIVSERHLNISCGFVRQVSSLDDADLTKPVLIVGYSIAKRTEGFKDILTKKISDTLFWTFSRTEKKEEFDIDIEKFKNYIVERLISKVRYYYFNPFKVSLTQAKKLLKLIKTTDPSTIYISDKAVYVLCGPESVVGVSFNVLSYIGIDREKVVKLIESNKANRVIYDNSRLPAGLVKAMGQRKYALPYLMTLK